MSDKLTQKIIDSRRLFYFYHVAQSGSFSRAEAPTSAPQPIISRHISKLEEELGVQLLERHGRGVTTTRYGEILLRRAETILWEMAEIIEELDAARRRPAGQVSIAASATIMSIYMPAIVNAFIVENPEVELTAIQTSTGEVYSQLLAGKVDIGIVLEMPNKTKFKSLPLSVEPMMLVVARNHPLANQKTVSRHALGSIELVLPASSHGLRNVIDKYARKGSVRLAPQLQIDSVPLIRAVVSDGRFATILPKSTSESEFSSDFAMLRINPSLNRTVYAAFARESRRLDHVTKLLKHVMAVFGVQQNSSE
jgi:LysR family nitrogen assimilation transcriptional regulator